MSWQERAADPEGQGDAAPWVAGQDDAEPQPAEPHAGPHAGPWAPGRDYAGPEPAGPWAPGRDYAGPQSAGPQDVPLAAPRDYAEPWAACQDYGRHWAPGQDEGGPWAPGGDYAGPWAPGPGEPESWAPGGDYAGPQPAGRWAPGRDYAGPLAPGPGEPESWAPGGDYAGPQPAGRWAPGRDHESWTAGSGGHPDPLAPGYYGDELPTAEPGGGWAHTEPWSAGHALPSQPWAGPDHQRQAAQAEYAYQEDWDQAGGDSAEDADYDWYRYLGQGLSTNAKPSAAPAERPSATGKGPARSAQPGSGKAARRGDRRPGRRKSSAGDPDPDARAASHVPVERLARSQAPAAPVPAAPVPAQRAPAQSVPSTQVTSKPVPSERSAGKEALDRPGRQAARSAARARRGGRSGKHSRWRFAGLAGGAIVLVASAAVVLSARTSGGVAHVMVTPSKLGNYAQAPSLARDMGAAALQKQIVASSSGEAKHVVYAVYEEATGPAAQHGPQIILFIGGNRSGTSASSFMTSFAGKLAGAATTSAGSMGGAAACVPSVGGRLAECAWADNDTFGVIASPTLSASALASELRTVRPLVEKRAG
ncbi:MAG: hypothetical protein ABSB01_06500 [Streptosporangiaceae bacterium]